MSKKYVLEDGLEKLSQMTDTEIFKIVVEALEEAGIDYESSCTKKMLEELWDSFGDIPMNPETEEMEAPFLHFPAGTWREDIWHWFDERYPGGVVKLLYPSMRED